MRLVVGFIVGATLVTLWHIAGWRVLAWLLTRIPPATPNGWAPRYRTWQDGVETDG